MANPPAAAIPLGTKNKTPVAMAVKAVPLNKREYMLPRRPITVAPMKETTSERSKMYSVASRLVMNPMLCVLKVRLVRE